MVITAHPTRIDRNSKPMPTVTTAMEGLALNQNLNHLVFQLFDLENIQQAHDILYGITMGHSKTKQTPVIRLELDVPTVLVVLITGTRFEQEHRQTSRQVSGQLISRGFFTAIIHLTHPVKQLRKVLANGAVHFIDKLLFLLLLAGGSLLLGYRLTLFSFFCSALGVKIRFNLSVFSSGVWFLKVKLIKNRSLFIKSAGKIKFQYSATD
jgi:hypothetical protein